MTMRRFRTRDGHEGVEWGDGYVTVETTAGAVRYLSFVNAERHHGKLDWIDPPRPDFAPTALASVVLPELLGDPGEFVSLLAWTSGITPLFWSPVVAVGLCRLITPHLERQFPWLRTARRRWVVYEDPAEAAAQREDYEKWLGRLHTGPHRVEPLGPRERWHRLAAMKVSTARPWPTVEPIGPMHLV